MKQANFMDTLFFNENLTITNLDKGLTNHNFLIDTKEDRFVFRKPYEDSEHIVHRHHEAMALRALKDCDIDVETIYFDECSGYKVTRYLSDAKTYQECPYEDKIERVAALMKKFHGLQLHIEEDFAPIARLEAYASKIKQPLFDLTPYYPILDDVRNLQKQHTSVLCHNDWVDGNILFTDEKTYLIDYEYAGNNDPLFDVMSFLSENQITDTTLRNRFYKVYFEHIDEHILHQLDIWENFHNLLWCNWAMMMYEHRNEPIYRTIANDKYLALKANEKKLFP